MVASIRNTSDLLTPIQRRVQKMVCRMADCVLVNAEAIRDDLLAQGYDPSKIVVIRNGITLSKFAAKEREPGASAASWDCRLPPAWLRCFHASIG